MSKAEKTEIRFFTICEWENEQDYLREQQRAGWKFVRVDWLCRYHFEACEPEDVVYQLDYNPDGLQHKAEYVQMFRDCGWEYLQDMCGYSYFRKPASAMGEHEEEIFCDDSSRGEMLRRVFKGRLLPLIVLFLCNILPQVALNSHRDGILASVFAGLAALYLVNFAWFGYQYWKTIRK